MTSSFSIPWFKVILSLGLILIFTLSAWLWLSTPDLFEYFNMAFCAH